MDSKYLPLNEALNIYRSKKGSFSNSNAWWREAARLGSIKIAEMKYIIW